MPMAVCSSCRTTGLILSLCSARVPEEGADENGTSRRSSRLGAMMDWRCRTSVEASFSVQR